MHISAAQCRAARGWLDMEQRELADLARCHRDTLRRFERQVGVRLKRATLDDIRVVFEARGIVFAFGPGGEPIGIELPGLVPRRPFVPHKWDYPASQKRQCMRCLKTDAQLSGRLQSAACLGRRTR